MELLQLRYFRAVATLGNMSKAAQELFVSQPNLSISISRLETELGVSLFDRRKGRIVLNRNGEQFLRCVEHVLATLDAGIQDLQRQNEDQLALSLAFMADDRELLTGFVLAHPEINIQHQNMNMQELTQALLCQEIEIALTVIPPTDERLNFQRISESDFVMIMSKRHPLAEKPTLTHRELANEQFAVDTTRVDINRFYTDAKKKGLTPNVTHKVHELDLLLALVQTNRCIAPMSDALYEKLVLQNRCEGIVRKRLSDGPPVAYIGVAWNKTVPLSKGAILFRDFARRHFNEISYTFQKEEATEGQ